MESKIQNPKSKIRSSRALAVRRLLRIEKEGAFIGASDEDAADPREERQAREYVSGITRQRRWLDFLLADFYRGRLADMERALKQILRVGLYDLLFLSTPSHAAVHEPVELAKQMVRPGAAGLVNGILRSVERRREQLPEPQTGEAAEDLAIRHSHPIWMVQRWLERFGLEETTALLEQNNRRPAYGVRPNPLRWTLEDMRAQLREQEADGEPSSYLDDFVRLKRLQPVLRAGWLEEGRCAVLDESAGLVVRLLDPRPGETLIDGCAAPGGKTCYAAARLKEKDPDAKSRVRAVDRDAGRLKRLQDAARTQGLDDMISTEAADLRAVAERPDPPRADAVLLDVPCSGLGVLAKRADLRWRRSPSDLDELTALQDQLLEAAARLVRPGGRLVYSTCTIEPEENEARVRAFLEQREDFSLEPAAGRGLPGEVTSPEGFLATLPHRHGTDGAFGACLRRDR